MPILIITLYVQSGKPVINKLVAERWEDVASEEDGIKKALTEPFAFLNAAQVRK